MKWFWQRDESPAAAARDMSIDAYAEQFLNFGGNIYQTTPMGGNYGAWQFGGFSGPATGIGGNEEASSEDFEAMAGGIYKASAAVFAVHNFRRAVFSEARMCFQKINDDGRPGDLTDSPALDILRKPWKGGVTRDLLTKAIMYADLGGNAFMVRDSVNGQSQIKLLRPDWTMILMSGDPKTMADVEKVALVYKPGNTQDPKAWKVYPFDGSLGAVAHWAPIPDPQATYRGMSWFDPILREAQTDKAMSLTKLRYFQNGARPGLVASFDPSVQPEEAAEFQELFNRTKVGSENMYKPLFLGGGCSVTQFKLELDDFEKISAVGELRIAAVGQVAPTLIGLTESMKGSALNDGNFQAAKDSFADGTMRPLWGSFSEAIAPLIDTPDNQRTWYDDRDISFLRQDQQLVAQRKQTDASTINSLVQQGYQPDAAVNYVLDGDLKHLLGPGHTGLYSVQLTPPGIAHAADFTGVDQADLEAEKMAGQQGSGSDADSAKKPIANNFGSGSAKKPTPGRPPNQGK